MGSNHTVAHVLLCKGCPFLTSGSTCVRGNEGRPGYSVIAAPSLRLVPPRYILPERSRNVLKPPHTSIR
jgi:hypothetical protein